MEWVTVWTGDPETGDDTAALTELGTRARALGARTLHGGNDYLAADLPDTAAAVRWAAWAGEHGQPWWRTDHAPPWQSRPRGVV